MNTTSFLSCEHSAINLNNNNSYFQPPLGTAFGLCLKGDVSSPQEKPDENYEEDYEYVEAKAA